VNPSPDTPPATLTPEQIATMREQVIEVLRNVHDPEIPVNIYDLGLIYHIDLTEAGALEVRMTLTSPSCPVAETLPPEVEQKVGAVEGVTSVKVHVVWDPPWTPEMMTEEAKLELNMF
jgi:FeS assembly SUF system protein